MGILHVLRLKFRKFRILEIFHPWERQIVSSTPEERCDLDLHYFLKCTVSIFRFFMPPKELWEAYSNRTVRPSVSPSVRPSVRPSRFRVRSISPIFFEVGIPNLVCGYILGWRSVAYHFRVTATLTLTSDLVFIIIVSGVYLLYYLR